MDGLVFITGVIGNIISVLMFLSPGKTFVRIVKNKSTEEFESLPYICTLLNSSLWTIYGVIKPGSYLVATVNGFGVVVEILYVVLFLIFAPPPKRVRTGILVGILNIGFLAAALSAIYFLLGEEQRIDAIGLLSSGLNIIMYGSPLSVVKRVVTTKSAEYMPFLLSFFLFLNGGVWTFYALLVQDWFLGNFNSYLAFEDIYVLCALLTCICYMFWDLCSYCLMVHNHSAEVLYVFAMPLQLRMDVDYFVDGQLGGK